MNKLAFLGLLFINFNFSTISHAEEGRDNLLRQLEIQNREYQQQIEFQRTNAALERLRAETERLRMLNEADEAADKQQELTERARQISQEQEESAKKAEEAAEEMRAHILQSEIKYKNQILLGIVFLIISTFLWRVIKKYKENGFMKYFEKFGIITILASGLLTSLVLMLSEPWVERFDFIQNLMTALELHLFQKEESCTYSCEYFISFPTKYAILTLMTLATYGFTTYLGITAPFKGENKNYPEKAQDSASLE